MTRSAAEVEGVLELNCWVHGDRLGSIFAVKIAATESISTLKERVKEKKQPAFDHVPADTLDLYKVDLPADERFIDATLALDPKKRLLPVKRLHGLFSADLEAENVHIVVGKLQRSQIVGKEPVNVADTIKLNCWVEGDDPRQAFTVEIRQDSNISNLREVIKEKKKPIFDIIPADTLELFKLEKPVPFDQLATFAQAMTDVTSMDNPTASLSEVFLPKALDSKHLHIFVKLPSIVPSVAHIAAIAAPETVTLNCWVLSDKPEHVFPVKIEKTESVGELKDRIKKKKEPVFDHIPADNLVLWQVSISPDGREAVLKGCKDPQTIDGARKLEATELLSEIFTQPSIKHLHIMVEASHSSTPDKVDENRRDNIGVLRTRYENLVRNILKADPPSKSATSSRYLKMQIAYSILDGRYNADEPIHNIAPPIQLYNPAFVQFSAAIASKVTPADNLVRWTRAYMAKASAVYVNEAARVKALKGCLRDILGIDTERIQNPDMTCADGAVQKSRDSVGQYLLFLQEDKNEIGQGNSDPSTQAGFSVARYWAQDKYETMRNLCCCPTFILATAGPWITVLGVVFTDALIVQRLTDFVWVCVGSAMNEPQVLKVAMLFHALKEGLARLDKFYKNLPIKPSPARFFPSITCFPDNAASNGQVDFEYAGYLEDDPDCVTFHARTCLEPRSDIVVKYVDRYGKEAHELLAEHDLAPKLYYHGPLPESDGKYDGMWMVVMEYINGETLRVAKRRMNSERREQVKLQIKRAVDILHDAQLVFGDLREDNVMWTKDEKVRLVDFNWAGSIGITKYPSALSTLIRWPKGVEACALIEYDHDTDMLNKIMM